MKLPWLEKIKTEHLPEEFRNLTLEIEGAVRQKLLNQDPDLAEDLALTAMLVVMEYFEGDEPYFPVFDGTKFLEGKKAAIKAEWRKQKALGNLDPKIIAQKYGLTVRRIRSIVNDHEDQEELFPSE